MNKYGRGDLMAIAAFRYCLGRQYYIVGDCADWLTHVWPELERNSQEVIKRALEEEFRRDDAARIRGEVFKPLGMDMDRAEWERVRKLWA